MVAFLRLLCYADKREERGEWGMQVTKRVVIAGSRAFDNYDEARLFISERLASWKQEEIVVLSGGARGADAIGERYAKEHGWEIERYPAEWKKYGKAAGVYRNKQMAERCDVAICFWDGHSKGTKSMIALVRKYNKPLHIKEVKF